MAIITLVTENILPIVHTSDFTRPITLHIEPVFQMLTIAQSAVVVSDSPFIQTYFSVTQSLFTNKVIQASASDFFPINSFGARVKPYNLGNLLIFSQAAYKVLPNDLQDFFTITQDVKVIRGLTNFFSVSQSITCNIVKLEVVTHSLTFVDSCTALLDNNWQFTGIFTPVVIADYDPNALNLPPVPATPQPVQLIGGSYNLTFTNVDFGDEDRVEHTRISRRARGENLIVYRDPSWPKTETLKFKIQDLSATQGKSILNFINDTLAQEIEFHDWIGIHWSGVITNPNAQLVQSVRDQACGSGSYEIELQFQGVQIPY